MSIDTYAGGTASFSQVGGKNPAALAMANMLVQGLDDLVRGLGMQNVISGEPGMQAIGTGGRDTGGFGIS
jgi:hypothetical protein